MTKKLLASEENREALLALLQREMGSRSSHEWKEPGNKYEHGIRSAKLVLRLRDLIFPGTEDPSLAPEILTAAAWFHDICNGQEEHENHEEAGAVLLGKLLAPYCTPEELSAVCAIVRLHDHRTPEPEKTLPDAVKLVQDADMLDHLGTYDVWITISEFTYRHKTPMDYAVQFRNGAFDRFASGWRCRINYPESLAIFDEKIAYERAFAERMLRELDGEIQ